jgi:hypothetical protein
MPEVPNIFSKVSQLIEEIGYIQKDSKNAFHKYTYLSHAQLMEKVQPALIKLGLIVVPNAEFVSYTDGVAIVKVTIQLVSEVDGSAITVSALGSGQDQGDKAVMKANTAAHKYAFMQLLCAPTGDDPEADEKTDAKPRQALKPMPTLAISAQTKG